MIQNINFLRKIKKKKYKIKATKSKNKKERIFGVTRHNQLLERVKSKTKAQSYDHW
jgi:hypothetical protein